MKAVRSLHHRRLRAATIIATVHPSVRLSPLRRCRRTAKIARPSDGNAAATLANCSRHARAVAQIAARRRPSRSTTSASLSLIPSPRRGEAQSYRVSGRVADTGPYFRARLSALLRPSRRPPTQSNPVYLREVPGRTTTVDQRRSLVFSHPAITDSDAAETYGRCLVEVSDKALSCRRSPTRLAQTCDERLTLPPDFCGARRRLADAP